MQVKESRDGDGWFDIRDELSAPTVVYVKWREGDCERGGQTKYEPCIIRANTTTDGGRTDGGRGENDFRGNRSRGNDSEGKQREIRHLYHMVDSEKAAGHAKEIDI